MSFADLTYFAATCTYCTEGMWGFHGRTGWKWGHIARDGMYRNGAHTAFPADDSRREIGYSEFAELSEGTA